MQLTRVFFDINMHSSFNRLRDICKEAKTRLGEGVTVLFINRKQTAFKILRSDRYIVYFNNYGKQIPLNALIYLPSDFGGSQLELDAAVRKVMLKQAKFFAMNEEVGKDET